MPVNERFYPQDIVRRYHCQALARRSKTLQYAPEEIIFNEALRRGVFMPGTTFIKEGAFKLLTEMAPITCVDMLPVRRTVEGIWQIGIVTRMTGPEAGKPAVIGGILKKGVPVMEAIQAHLQKDFETVPFLLFETITPQTPFMVQRYSHANAPTDNTGGYDPTKESVALTFLIKLDDTPTVKPYGEVSDFRWIDRSQLPPIEDTAYRHGIVMEAAFTYLEKAEQSNIK